MSKHKALLNLRSNHIKMAAFESVLHVRGIEGAELIENWRARVAPLSQIEWAVKKFQQWCIKEMHPWMDSDDDDGWPGLKFDTSLWVLFRIGPDEVVERLKSVADGPDSLYLMDSTTSRAFENVWDRDGDGGDCSDYLAYGFMRRKAGMYDWKNSRGQKMYVATDNLPHLLEQPDGWLRECDDSKLPFVVFYPDYYVVKDGKSVRRQGHTAVVTEIRDGRWWGYDCSWSQGKKGDAIKLRDLSFFQRKTSTRICRPPWWG